LLSQAKQALWTSSADCRELYRFVAEHVAGYLKRDGFDVDAGEVDVPGPDESVQGRLGESHARLFADKRACLPVLDAEHVRAEVTGGG
jgi:hypothetical protein